MTMKIDLTTDEVTHRPSNSADPRTSMPSVAAMRPITIAMNGALMRPTTNVLNPDGVLKARDKDGGRHAGIDPTDQETASHLSDVREERQNRQSDHQCDQPGDNQHFQRVKRHHLQSVDLFAHLHRADLGGDRRSGPARNHDRSHEHAEFAQTQDANQADRVIGGAEFGELKDALLSDDRADQKVDQENDGHAAQPIHLEVVDHRSPAPAPRLGGETQEHRNDFAEIVDNV